MIFAGTESDGFPDTRGRQAAFLIHPTRAPVPQPYTDSQDEVEALALNPGGIVYTVHTFISHTT